MMNPAAIVRLATLTTALGISMLSCKSVDDHVNEMAVEISGLQTARSERSIAVERLEKLASEAAANPGAIDMDKVSGLYESARSAMDRWIGELEQHLDIKSEVNVTEAGFRDAPELKQALEAYYAYPDVMGRGVLSPILLDQAKVWVDKIMNLRGQNKRDAKERLRAALTELKWPAAAEVLN